MEQLTLFKQFPLFNKLNDQELEHIVSGIAEKTYSDGTLICKQGEAGGSLYLITQGNVSVTLPLYHYDQKQQVVSLLKPGMFFGELSFFDGKSCSADVHAHGDVTLLELKRAVYDELIDSDPEVGYDIQNKIILNLIHTIRKMDERYSRNAFLR